MKRKENKTMLLLNSKFVDCKSKIHKLKNQNPEMKKTYIIPSVEVINIDTIEMLAVSIQITGQKGSEQLGNERGDERQWGNIWNE